MIPLESGAIIPLFVAVSDLSSQRVVTADVIKINPYEVIAQNVELSFIEYSLGHYQNDEIEAPLSGIIQANYFVYSEDNSDGPELVGVGSQVFGIGLALGGGSGGADVSDTILIGEIQDDVIEGYLIENAG